MDSIGFNLMSLWFKLRDRLSPPERILSEAGMQPGFQVLDYGCGPGSYLVPLAELVGESGMIYALDIHPLAIYAIRGIALKKRLTNVGTILTDAETELPDNSVDVVLLYDILHDLSEPERVLTELQRIIKPDGILSVTDHHMKEDETITKLTKTGLFSLKRLGQITYSFTKEAAKQQNAYT